MKKMSFSDTLKRMRSVAESDWGKKFAALNAKAAKSGNLGASRRWIGVQTAMQNEVSDFAEKIRVRLTQFDPEHSPYSDGAFSNALDAVKDFSEYLEGQYRDDSNLQPYGGSKPPFDTGSMDTTVAVAQDRISEAKAEFMSRRSFWKWALGDFQKSLWSGLLLVCGAAIMWALQQIGSMIIQSLP